MALTPEIFVIEDEDLSRLEEDEPVETTEVLPSLTFALDLENGVIGGYIDGETAIQQFIRKAIYTARNRYLIYSDGYGSEVEDIASQNLPLSVLEIEIPRLIEDALIYDDRIASVDNFDISQEGDKLIISFEVTLTNGELIESEVTL